MSALMRPARTIAVAILAAASVATVGGAEATPPSCFSQAATIVAVPGRTTIGTPGPDVIVGTSGADVIHGRGGADRICARTGNDEVRGGGGADLIDLGAGTDVAWGGGGADRILGKRGSDELHGDAGRDTLVGGPGRDELLGGKTGDTLRAGAGFDRCNGQAGPDRGVGCEQPQSLTEPIADTFAGTGPLVGYTTNNAGALPDVMRRNGRYRAAVTDNTGNVTLHFHQDQGRLDAKLVEFPFDIVVRNIGIGTIEASQTAPAPSGNPYLFSGVQVHVPNLSSPTSSHVVVGHRGGTHFTVEGKNTTNGSSSVNDAGPGIVPDGRADIRIVGNADRTLTVYWQRPHDGPPADDAWMLYDGDGRLPGPPPAYPGAVYVGLITYAFGETGLPFVGTADALEAYR